MKARKAIYILVTELGTNVANVNVLERFMSLEISNLDHKRVWSIVLPIDIKLGHDDGMVGGSPKRSNPPLGSSQGR